MDKKKTLEDIFNDDEFGILDSKPKNADIKTEDERLIESFQEINAFFEKNNRLPQATNVTEFKLLSRLNSIKKDGKKVAILTSFDTFNFLSEKEEVKTVSDIFEDDDLGIFDSDEALSIFELKHVPSSTERAASDFVAQRTAMKEKEFLPYEPMFKKVHKELKEGKRKLFVYENADKNLKAGSFYILNGIMLYLEEANMQTDNVTLPSGDRLRKDGRTRIIFENGTISNMLYRSLDKALLHSQNDGKIVSKTEYETERELFQSANLVKEEDVETGWIYILQSKSTNKDIASMSDLYKIGYSTVPVPERIKNAAKEPTYLMADVKIIDAFKTYNLNAQKFEHLVHRFFAEVCLNIDIHNNGKRISPREWFVVPLNVILEVIDLILSGEITNYSYNKETKTLNKN